MSDKLIDDKDFTLKHFDKPDGNHDGSIAYGHGFTISFQRGPIEGKLAKNQNGAFSITIIRVSIAMMEYYQASKFNCKENGEALEHLKKALSALESRRSRRDAEGKTGTQKV